MPLGAIWSVYDERAVGSWIDRELDLLREADRAGVPVLGICFGGQALAAAHGGEVVAAPAAEIGFTPVDSDDPDLVPPGPWMQWHHDVFTVPPGGVEVARNAVGPQAFRLRRNLGLQFHPEVDAAIVASWVEMGGAAAQADLEAATGAGLDAVAGRWRTPNADTLRARRRRPSSTGSSARSRRPNRRRTAYTARADPLDGVRDVVGPGAVREHGQADHDPAVELGARQPRAATGVDVGERRRPGVASSPGTRKPTIDRSGAPKVVTPGMAASSSCAHDARSRAAVEGVHEGFESMDLQRQPDPGTAPVPRQFRRELGEVGQRRRAVEITQVVGVLAERRLTSVPAVPHDQRAGPERHEQRLVGVERDRVGPLDPGQPAPVPVGQLEEPAVGAVDVEPDAEVGGEVGEVVEGVDGTGVRGPRGRDDRGRHAVRRRGPA